VKGRRRPTPRERSSLLSFYFQHGGGEGLGEGQEEANTQGEVVIPVILFPAWRRRGTGGRAGGGQHPGRSRQAEGISRENPRLTEESTQPGKEKAF
jgi:hypothetical protein